MKRWTLSIIIITLILNINGCTANGSGHNDTNNQEGTLNEINSTNVESDFNKIIKRKIKNYHLTN